MDFKRCHVCGAYNPPAGRFCSGCGADISRNPIQPQQPPQRSEGERLFIPLAIFAVILVFSVFVIFNMTKKPSNPSNTEVNRVWEGTVNSKTVVCKEQTTIPKFARIIETKDYGYLAKLDKTGEIFMIEEGTRVKCYNDSKVGNFIWVIIKSGYHAEETGYIPESSLHH